MLWHVYWGGFLVTLSWAMLGLDRDEPLSTALAALFVAALWPLAVLVLVWEFVEQNRG